MTASHATRSIAYECLGPLDDATNLTSVAPAAPQEEVLCRLQPIVDLASRESIEWQLFVAHFAEEHAGVALA